MIDAEQHTDIEKTHRAYQTRFQTWTQNYAQEDFLSPRKAHLRRSLEVKCKETGQGHNSKECFEMKPDTELGMREHCASRGVLACHSSYMPKKAAGN